METGPEPHSRASVRGSLILLAIGLLGLAINRTNGTREGTALVMVCVAWVSAALAFFLPDLKVPRRTLDGLQWSGAALLFGFFVYHLLTTPPGMYLRPIPIGQWPYLGGVVALAVGSGLAIGGPEKELRRFLAPLIIITVLGMGWWILTASPAPHIDVFVFQRDGVGAIAHGNNPYALRYPDIYGNSPFYGPGVSVNGVLQFGFPYPPTSLLWAMPGQLILGDYRWSHLLGLLAAGALLVWLVPSRRPLVAALALFSAPRFYFILEQGWTEPMLVFLLAVVVTVAVKKPKWTPYALGLFLSAKQYMPVMYPLALLLLPRPFSWKAALDFTLRAGVVVLAINLPFVLWNAREYFWSVWELQFVQPFRTDSLTFAAWFQPEGGQLSKPVVLAPFIISLALLGPMARFGRRTPADFALGLGVLFLAFFVTSKQAFANYYSFPFGALCIAFALLELKPAEPAPAPVAPEPVKVAASA